MRTGQHCPIPIPEAENTEIVLDNFSAVSLKWIDLTQAVWAVQQRYGQVFRLPAHRPGRNPSTAFGQRAKSGADSSISIPLLQTRPIATRNACASFAVPVIRADSGPDSAGPETFAC